MRRPRLLPSIHRLLLLGGLWSTSFAAFSQIAAWQFGTPQSSGDEVSYAATTLNANLVTGTQLTRGSGVSATALQRGFSANNWDISATQASAIANNEYIQFTLTAASGYQVSLSTLDARMRRTSTAPNAYLWRYSLDGTNFNDIGSSVAFTSTSDGVTQAQINLSSITALQSVPAATTLTFRLYAWGGSSTTATFAIARYAANNTTNSLAIGGTVTTASASNTSVQFVNTTSASSEGTGTTNLALAINNPDPVNATSVTISATGATGRITSFTTPVTFAGGSSANENVIVTLDNNAVCDGDADVYFSITGISGGQGTAFIGAPSTDTLTVTDDDALAVPVATTPTVINSNDFTATWNASAGATGYELDVYTTGPVPTSGLFFSEYVEGSSNNKYLEIFNGTGGPVDLTHYTVKLFTNGTTTPTSTNILSGNLANNDVLVLRNSGAILYLGTATIASTTGFNGDDAVLLLNNVTGDTLDIIGHIGQDPGAAWTGTGGRTTLNATLVRNASVTGGITANPATGFPSLDSEWTVLVIDDVSDLGSHSYAATGEVMVSGSPFILGNVTSYSVNGLDAMTDYYFHVRATGGACPTTNNSNTVQVTTAAGTSPILMGGTLTDFGDICLNADGGPFSFTVDGLNLTTADVTGAALNGFTFSTTELGTYTSTLSIPQAGGTFSQEIWVKFTPTLAQSYDGDITVGGGGASAITVAATGSGINSAPMMATGSVVSIGMDQAEVSGSLTDEGCSTLTDYGIEYSTTQGFIPGTGTPVSSSNIAGNNFSSFLTGLSPCTTYYYAAYGTNAGGTTYGTVEFFATDPIGAPVATMPGTISTNDFTATWNSVAGASTYRLDVSTLPQFGTPVVASDLFISEYIEGGSNNKYIEIFNGTGSAVNLSHYALQLFANGSGSITVSDTLSGTLANGATIVYANSGATAYAGPATNSGAVNFNGDDAFALRNVATNSYSDIIGTIGEDPGTRWDGTGGRSTLNKTLVRNPDVTGGVTTNPATGFPTLDGEWAVYVQDDVSFLGSHDFNTIAPNYLPGYEDLAVGGTSQSVTGLNSSTTYYYRVRAEAVACASENSSTIAVTTLACPGNSFVVAIRTDANGDQTSWEILDESNNSVATGGPYTGENNTLVTETICIGTSPVSACYKFHLYDSYGDGLTGNGFWQLRSTGGRVLLGDDFANGYGSPSPVPANPSYTDHTICLPPGNTHIGAQSCGILSFSMNSKVYCTNAPNATTNQFEFSDPDAGFIRRISVNANWVRFSMMHTSPLTPGVKYFVRARNNGSGPIADAHFGGGCEVGMTATLPCTELISAPTYGHSCNEERTFNTNNSFIYATPVVGATEYQFRISIPGEGYDQTFIRSTYILQLKWNTSVAPPLVNGSTYNVQVNVKVGTLYSGFCGDVCTITINNNPGNALRPAASMVQANGTATMWPNPVRDGQVNLSIDGIQDADQRISVDIQDIFGKQVFAKQFGNSGERFSTLLDLPGDIASGVYMVNITINGKSTVQRLSIIR